MDEVKIVELFEGGWHKVTTNTLVALPDRAMFSHEYQSFKLFLMVSFGKRNVLTEQVILIDSSKPIVADRLHLAQVNSTCGRIAPLEQMRIEMSNLPQTPENKLQLLVRHMTMLLVRINAAPETFYREITLPRKGLVFASVQAMSGGAWGTSKH